MALIHYKDQWPSLVKAGMNIIFHEMREISLNNCENICLSKKDTLHCMVLFSFFMV